jgi:hypothetical protein
MSDASALAARMRGQARQADKDCPGMQIGGHLQDAAALVEAGNTEGAQRHLRAAAGWLTTRNLYRHGLMTDKKQAAARGHLDRIGRHLASVKDLEDMNAPAHTGAGPPSGTANGPSQYVTAGRPPPEPRSWIKAGENSAGERLFSNGGVVVTEHEPGYLDGWLDAV